MWDKNLVELLIKKYREHENLYDACNPYYTDRIKRSNSLFEISEELQAINKSITVDDVKKKIHTLRSQYIKQCREMVNIKQNNTGSEGEYEPRLWCFDQLDFLKQHCGMRKSISIIQKINEYDENELDVEDPLKEEIKTPTTSPNCNKKTDIPSLKGRKSNLNLEERVDNIKTLLMARLMEKKEYDWLGKQVVFEISSLKDESLKRATVWKIQSLLRDAYLMDNEPSSQECDTVFQF